MQKLIIGCGYLGERVAAAWIARGDVVSVLTRSPVRSEWLATKGLTTRMGDVLEPESLRQLPRAEVVLYAVGFDRTGKYSKRSVYVDGLQNVLKEIADQSRQFIYVSSTSVYGQNGGEFVDETSSTEPHEEDGRICLDAEAVVWDYFDRAQCGEKQGAIILRLAGIYGPARLLTRIEQLRRGDPLSGNPDAWLNLIHVDDAVRAVLAAEQRGRSGESYLVCDDRPLRRAEYYAALAASIGVPPPRFADLAINSSERQQLNKRCVNRRLRQELAVELEYPTVIEGLAGLPEALR